MIRDLRRQADELEAALMAKEIRDNCPQLIGQDEVFPPLAFIDPGTGKRYPFGRSRVQWELFRVLWRARRPYTYGELVADVESWDGRDDENVVRGAVFRLRKFWEDQGRRDIAKAIVTGGNTVEFTGSRKAQKKHS
jgi:hypothetical protein